MIKSCYIHIPFCSHICSYCDFCKVFYNEKVVDDYLESLANEIELYYRGETLKTLYIGGGTPSSLSILQWKRLFEILKTFHLEEEYEYTVECNIENINLEKLQLFRENGVNRISVGIESFQPHLLEFLERHYTPFDISEKMHLVKKYFSNINVDLMYAIPGESLVDLENDLNEILSLGVSHISTYSLILEKNTKLSIQNTKYIDEELDLEMYNFIRQKLSFHGYHHYEISNFSLPGMESSHNLTYWRNLPYYGFGLGASGYVDSIRYTNTKSMTRYLDKKYRYEEQKMDSVLDRENQIMLGFRTLEGISKSEFVKKFGKKLEEYYDVAWMIPKKILVFEDNRYYINPEYWYILNEILVYFIGE